MQLRATCVQYIRGMFEVVRETEAYQRLPAALRDEVQTIKGSKPSKERAGPGASGFGLPAAHPGH